MFGAERGAGRKAYKGGIKRKMVTLKENYFHHLVNDNICICKIGDEVEPMWGMDCILLTTEQINALLNGDCIWFTNEEYATVLRMEK